MERPKVRFSKCYESSLRKSDEEKTKNCVGKDKIKIKNVLPTNFPIKVLQDGKRVLIKNTQSLNDNSEADALIEISEKHACNVNRGANVHNFTSATEDLKPLSEFNSGKSRTALHTKASNDSENWNTQLEGYQKNKEVHKVKNCVDKFSIIDDKQKSSDSSNYTKDSITSLNKRQVTSLICDDMDVNNDTEIVQIFDSKKTPLNVQNIKHYDICKDKQIRTNNKQTNNCEKINKSKISQKNNKENCHANIHFQKQNELVKFRTPNILKDTTISQLPEIVSMKDQKFKLGNNIKVLSSTNTKKAETVLKMHLNKGDCLKVNRKKNALSKNILSHPEYNSTICVIKKLKEVETEKSINIEHLPSTYTNLLHEKISALDFAPYETVYKDLINLSVDEHKISSKFVRSKDPKPRDKDIIPNLSDFYNPKYKEEYFVVLNPLPLNPVSINTLNAFTISNKIYTWKICRDNF